MSASDRWLIAGAVLWGVLALMWCGPNVWGQSGTRSAPGTQVRERGRSVTARPAEEPYEVRFWNWLQTVQYKNWGPMPGNSDGFYDGTSPHGDRLKLYVNRTAAGNPKELPNGSILVKENYDAEGRTLMAVTVMYRARGFDPEHGDWYWAKYEADGRVSRMNGMPVAGKVGMCVECHSGADGNDFAFANDP